MYASQPSCLPCDEAEWSKGFGDYSRALSRAAAYTSNRPQSPRAYTQAPTYYTQYRAYTRACYTSNSSRVLEGASSHTRRASMKAKRNKFATACTLCSMNLDCLLKFSNFCHPLPFPYLSRRSFLGIGSSSLFIGFLLARLRRHGMRYLASQETPIVQIGGCSPIRLPSSTHPRLSMRAGCERGRAFG